jgi:succinate-acetate transporter protein
LATFIDSTEVVIFMTVITIFGLFFDDIRVLEFNQSTDDIFFGMTLFGMICFTLEMFISSFAKKDYVFSFFFWLDIISTLSMIPSCGWIWEPIIAGID